MTTQRHAVRHCVNAYRDHDLGGFNAALPHPHDPTDLPDAATGSPALSDVLAELAAEGRPITVAFADLPDSDGLDHFARMLPGNCVHGGEFEQDLLAAADELAMAGRQTYVSAFASCLTLLSCEPDRAVSFGEDLPVRLIGHNAGIGLGFAGRSHHAIEDVAVMRAIEPMTVLAPADDVALAALVRDLKDHPGPVYLRTGGAGRTPVYAPGTELVAGRAHVHREGRDGTIIATGTMVRPALAAERLLAARGIDVGVVDMHTIKPLDAPAVLRAVARTRAIMTVEEHSVHGGLGRAVAGVLASTALPHRLTRHGVTDETVPKDPSLDLYRHYGLDAQGIADAAAAAFDA